MPVAGTIPYSGGGNPSWLGNQFHQYLDTTKLLNVIAGGPGTGNGQFLLVLEVFDSAGSRLVPATSAAPTATDTRGTFNYVRLLDSAHPSWQDRAHFFAVAARNFFANSWP